LAALETQPQPSQEWVDEVAQKEAAAQTTQSN
jgi:hypothetical protein